MKANVMNLGSSAVISLLLILPCMIMEIVNRRPYQEDFPGVLFFVMWFNALAISLIVLPIIRSRLFREPGKVDANSAPRNSLLTNPRSAAIISIALFLTPILLAFLDAQGWIPLQSLINGPNPEQEYLPGLFITAVIFALPVAAGMIAGVPVVRTLRAGGSLFAHPVNVIIVGLLLATFAFGLVSLIVDQWPCFIGVPVCD